MQEHELDLQALAEAVNEAQKAEEQSAMLAAEVHQMQMEIAAKQVRLLLVTALCDHSEPEMTMFCCVNGHTSAGLTYCKWQEYAD